MGNTIVIYHGGCWDGFCAAWLLRKKFPDAEFVPATHGDRPPPVEGKHVYIVDFSYDRDTLITMYRHSASLIVLDHHKTAREALDGLSFCIFDETKSGARLTHEYIDEKIDGNTSGFRTPPNWLVLYTEDRDLWKWELDSSREVNAALRSYPLDFELWDDLSQVDIENDFFVDQGAAILRAQQQMVDAKVEQSHEVEATKPPGFAGEWWGTWRVANATCLVSETSQALAGKCGIGVCWFELPSGERVYSLRANQESNVHVEEIAVAFGGGGHPNAAGFKLPRDTPHPWASESEHMDDNATGQRGN